MEQYPIGMGPMSGAEGLGGVQLGMTDCYRAGWLREVASA